MAISPPLRQVFRGSRYRRSEGWIDVVKFTAWQPHGLRQGGSSNSGGAAKPNKMGSLRVECVPDRATALLVQAIVDGVGNFGNAVLELRRGGEGIRHARTDVFFPVGNAEGGRIVFVLECEEPTVSSNAKSAHK